jgi:hypothetical protein
MQVRRQHEIDVFRRHPGFGQRMIQVTRALDGVHVVELVVVLVANPGIDQHRPHATHQQRPGRQADPVLVVGRRLGRPQHPRHHAKHRAAVEAEETIAQRRQFEVANLVADVSLCRAANRLRRRCSATRLLQLDQHAVRARRMNKRDQRRFCARSRLFINQANAAGFELFQRRTDVVDS